MSWDGVVGALTWVATGVDECGGFEKAVFCVVSTTGVDGKLEVVFFGSELEAGVRVAAFCGEPKNEPE